MPPCWKRGKELVLQGSVPDASFNIKENSSVRGPNRPPLCLDSGMAPTASKESASSVRLGVVLKINRLNDNVTSGASVEPPGPELCAQRRGRPKNPSRGSPGFLIFLILVLRKTEGADSVSQSRLGLDLLMRVEPAVKCPTLEEPLPATPLHWLSEIGHEKRPIS